MFDSLTEKFSKIFRDAAGYGRLNEENIGKALTAVRMALLEADVNFKVVKSFTTRVKEKAMGLDVAPGLNPGQQFVQIVHEELVKIMGEKFEGVKYASQPPTVFLVAGLQGSGKTTSVGKLAKLIKAEHKKIMLVAGDTYRPAAIDQLETIGKQIGVEVYTDRSGSKPVQIANDAMALAMQKGVDVVLVDTAGRLQIDEALMAEVVEIKSSVKPHEVLLVVDAMTGQEAVNVATEFNAKLGVTGVILTKLDGDARGGAALSIREVTGCPIKFVGMGEKMDALHPFHPDRMAQRILGMGDVLSLVEKVQSSIDQDTMMTMQQRMFSGEFNLDDFLNHFKQIRKLGPIKDVLKMIPGLSSMMPAEEMDVDDKVIKRSEAIIQSMTPDERKKVDLINGARRKRIAKGSGVSVQDVNQLLKQFTETREMMKQLTNFAKKGPGKLGKMKKRFKFPGF